MRVSMMGWNPSSPLSQIEQTHLSEQAQEGGRGFRGGGEDRQRKQEEGMRRGGARRRGTRGSTCARSLCLARFPKALLPTIDLDVHTIPAGYFSKSPFPALDRFVCEVARPGAQVQQWTFTPASCRVSYSLTRNRFCENVRRPHKSNRVNIICDLARGVWRQVRVERSRRAWAGQAIMTGGR